ncbi:MAG: hypothetical protein IJ354_02470 [Clostridia bacterium]|nr:hypothetical protein [Clostridia bacterium]
MLRFFKTHSEAPAKAAFVLTLVILLLIGRYTYADYGYTADVLAERTTALSNYQHASNVLLGHDVEGLDVVRLEDHKDKYYGVALQMPMVIVEHLTGFTMPMSDALHLRHFYIFLVCTVGWTCFYGFLNQVFKNRWLALLGMLMVVLYPRFYGEQFTNIKDMVFTAVCCAALYATALCLEHEGKWLYEIFAALAGAFCVNTRFIGLMIPLMLFGYRILRDLLLAPISFRRFLRNLMRYIAQLIMLFGFYYLITPAAWLDPAGYLPNVLSTFSNYNVWRGRVPFLGKMRFGDELPWYYIPFWLAVSVPVWYLVLLVLSVPLCALQQRRRKVFVWLLDEHRYGVLCLAIALAPFLGMLVSETTLYNGWRHVYFIFPPLVVLMLFGLRALWRLMQGRRLVRRMLALCIAVMLVWQGVWIVQAHPMEKTYFNKPGSAVADQLDRDYWYESYTHMLHKILEVDDTHRIWLWSTLFLGESTFNFLPQEEYERFYISVEFVPKVDYVLDVATGIYPANYKDFTPVYELRNPDGVLLSTIWLRTSVLEERFGGVWQ